MFGGRPYLNGRNQESSSEAISAYEGIAMYGSVMMKAFGNGRSAQQSDNDNAYIGKLSIDLCSFIGGLSSKSFASDMFSLPDI